MEYSDSVDTSCAIIDIQCAFSELISSHFADLWSFYSSGEISVQKAVALYLANSSRIVVPRIDGRTTALFQRIEDLLLSIDTFWALNKDSLKKAISNNNRLGVLVGDIDAVSHDYADSILKLGLYF